MYSIAFWIQSHIIQQQPSEQKRIIKILGRARLFGVREKIETFCRHKKNTLISRLALKISILLFEKKGKYDKSNGRPLRSRALVLVCILFVWTGCCFVQIHNEMKILVIWWFITKWLRNGFAWKKISQNERRMKSSGATTCRDISRPISTE